MPRRRSIDDRPHGVSDGALLWKVAEIELMLERGRNEEALAAAETHIELCDWRDNPAFAPGRRLKARALIALGRTDEGEEALREDLRLADWGSPGTVGRALAQLGALRGEAGTAELERGVELLEASPLKLDLARALTALGSRCDAGGAGPTPASRCAGRWRWPSRARRGADGRDQDRAPRDGARPRSSALSGPASLTASERRVADWLPWATPTRRSLRPSSSPRRPSRSISPTPTGSSTSAAGASWPPRWPTSSSRPRRPARAAGGRRRSGDAGCARAAKFAIVST